MPYSLTNICKQGQDSPQALGMEMSINHANYESEAVEIVIMAYRLISS